MKDDMKNSLLLFVFVATVFLVPGCATQQSGLPSSEGIANFYVINDGLCRGAQPDEVGMKRLQRLGVRTIVNLRVPKDAWAAEEAEARAAGIKYTNVPMSGLGRPTDEQVLQVLSMIETGPAPVFIHCRRGCDRTGTIIACYRIQHDQWPSEFALREAERFGMSRWECKMKDYILDFGKSQPEPSRGP